MKLSLHKKRIKQKKAPGPSSSAGSQSNLLITYFFVTVNYALFLLPFSYLALAQYAAIFGKRKSLILHFCSVFSLCLAGYLFSFPALTISGLLALLATVFFYIPIYFREKHLGKAIPFLVILAPFFLYLGFVVNAPHLTSLQFQHVLKTSETQVVQKLKDAQKAGQPAELSQFSTTDAGTAIENVHTFFQQISSDSNVAEFFSLQPTQRLLWVTLGPGSMFFFVLLLTCLACFVLLDLSYEQADKLLCALEHMKNNPKQFRDHPLALFFQPRRMLPVVAPGEAQMSVTKYEKRDLDRADMTAGSHRSYLSHLLLKVPTKKELFVVRENVFHFNRGPFSWNMSHMTTPIPVVGLVLCFLTFFIFHFKTTSFQSLLHLIPWGQPAGYFWTGILFASFIVLNFLLIQGFFTLFLRVRSLVLFLGFFLLLSLNSLNSSLFVCATVFLLGSLAILDYVYDWRNQKQRN